MSNDDLVMKTLLDIERTLGGVATEVKGMRSDLQAHIAKDEAYQSDADGRMVKVELHQERIKWRVGSLSTLGGAIVAGAFKLVELYLGGGHHR